MISALLEVIGTFGVMALYSAFALVIMLVIQAVVYRTTKISLYRLLVK